MASDLRCFSRNENRYVPAIALTCLAAFFGLVVNDSPTGVDTPEAPWVVASGIGLLVSLFLSMRAWRLGVCVGEEALVVRNLLRTFSIQLHSVRQLEMGQYRIVGSPVPVVLTTDGSAVRCSGLAPANPAFRPRTLNDAQAAIDAINRILRDGRHQ